MINETVILLFPFEDYSKHRLARHLPSYLGYQDHMIPHFYEPLQRIFSRLIVYDYPKRQTETGVRAVNEESIELVRKEHPKYHFITICTDLIPPTLDGKKTQTRRVIKPQNGVLVRDTAENFYSGLKEIFEKRHLFDSGKIRNAIMDYSWEKIVKENVKPYIEKSATKNLSLATTPFALPPRGCAWTSAPSQKATR